MNYQLYFVCTLERSGSEYLCWLLRSTGKLGDPREWYHKGESWRIQHESRYGVAYLRRVAEHTASPNGVFGVKIMYGTERQFGVLDAWDQIQREFSPRLVWLRRRDKLRQAISKHRAVETGQWARSVGDAAPRPLVAFSARRIMHYYEQLVRWDRGWEDVFRQLDIRPETLWYEDLLEDPLQAVKAVCDLFGESADGVDPASCPFAIQRDDVTETWFRTLTARIRSHVHPA